VKYLIQTVEKPNLVVVPQLAHAVFEGNRASFFTFFSAALDDMFSIFSGLSVLILDAAIGILWCIDDTTGRLQL